MSKKESPQKKKCSKCQKQKFVVRDFYMSDSDKYTDKRYPICKQCIIDELDTKNTKDLLSDAFIEKLKSVLLDMNRPYIHSTWVESVEESKRDEKEAFGTLMKNLHLNHRGKDWRDSEFSEPNTLINKANKTTPNREKKTDKQKQNDELNSKNEKDVLRLLGYDPFEHEAEEDRPGLYNKLIDYLSEDVLEDGLRLSSAISIVKTFNQIEKLDAAMAVSKPSDLGALVTAKQKLHGVINGIAKENGFSTGANSKNSAGSGTLTGIMKQLQEYNFHEATTNLFDIETAKGIKQVADISNSSIANQLKFDENDMNEMIRDQRQLIEEYESRAKKAEEENRLLNVKIAEKEKLEQELKKEIKELKALINQT